jgi:chromosome segregation protein
VAAAETAARAAQDAEAQVRARRAQAIRGRDDADARITRLKQQIEDVAHDAEQLAQQLNGDAAVADGRAALEAVQAAAAEAEHAALAAEAETLEAQAALEAARPILQEIEKTLNRLEAEAQTLNRFLNAGGTSLWPAIVDQLTVAPGYATMRRTTS